MYFVHESCFHLSLDEQSGQREVLIYSRKESRSPANSLSLKYFRFLLREPGPAPSAAAPEQERRKEAAPSRCPASAQHSPAGLRREEGS